MITKINNKVIYLQKFFMKIISILFLVIGIFFSSCFKKRSDKSVLLDFDLQKTVNKSISNIIYDPTANSGSYVTYADSISQYSFGLSTNAKLISKGNKKNEYIVSAYVKRSASTDKGSLDFQVLGSSNDLLYIQSLYITPETFVNANDWVKIEGKIVVPNDVKISNPENEIRIFLYCTGNRILLDDLEITTE
jgi:hypothetical protein